MACDRSKNIGEEMKYLTIDQYIESLNEEGKVVASTLRSLVHQSMSDVKEMIFVNHPFFYVPQEGINSFHKLPTSIMMFFFKDHVNIFAKGIESHLEELKAFKVTEKMTLQIYYDKKIDEALLKKVFRASLTK